MSANKITAQWVRSKSDELAVDQGCYFDLKAADMVRAFFAKFLRHSKGKFAGKPFELLDWQWLHFIGPIFGWKRANGLRRFRRFESWVPKKNGKSTIAAGLVINGLVNDGEAGAEVYGAAADRKQASIIFREVEAMIDQSDVLRKRLQVIESTRRVVYPAKHSFYEVLSKDSKKTGHGLNASLAVVDELHVVDRRMYDTLRYAGAARDQPLFGSISTAGDNKLSLGYERYTYCKRLLAGEIDDPDQFAFVAEADGNDKWEEPAQWKKANPSLGHTISPESFASDFREAKYGSPVDQGNFRQLRLNLWQDAAHVYLNMVHWDACGEPLDLEALAGRECFGGLDLANTLDLASFVLVFPEDEVDAPPEEEPEENANINDPRTRPLPRQVYTVLPFFFVPAEACRERERKNLASYRSWIEQGLIEATDGNEIDPRAIRRRINELSSAYKIIDIAYDPYNAGQIAQELQDDGFEMFKFQQSIANFNEPTTTLSRLVNAGKVRHGGNAVLTWMAGNMMVHTNGIGNVMPARKASADKIDGMVAAIMGLARALLAPSSEPSFS